MLPTPCCREFLFVSDNVTQKFCLYERTVLSGDCLGEHSRQQRSRRAVVSALRLCQHPGRKSRLRQLLLILRSRTVSADRKAHSGQMSYVSRHGITPCRPLSGSAEQTGSRQASPWHNNIVKSAYSWSNTSDACLDNWGDSCTVVYKTSLTNAKSSR